MVLCRVGGRARAMGEQLHSHTDQRIHPFWRFIMRFTQPAHTLTSSFPDRTYPIPDQPAQGGH